MSPWRLDMFSHFIRALLATLIIGLPHGTAAQAARVEVIPFSSLTLTEQQFLSGHEDGKPATLAGELRLPRAGTERFPLVIILHGSGGIGGNILDWEQEFLSMGVATFVIDSFSGRGIVSTINDQSQLGRLVQTEDAYKALALLANHPRIDPARVMLMGLSKGGHDALYASLLRFQRMHASNSSAQFAAYLVLYPNCSYLYRDDEDVAARPIRIFQGAADNYNPIAPCRAYVQRLRAKGADIELTEYTGVQHGFDMRSAQPPVTLAQAQTARNCQWKEGDNGQLYNSATKEPYSYTDPCVERGVVLAYDERAARDAKDSIREFVTATLRPTGQK